MHKPKVALVIMDGWGYSQVHKGNAIWQAKTPTFDYLWQNYSHTLLNSFGVSVGLPWGAIGSSEVGHTSIGCGRLINQELTRIDKEVLNGNFYKNKTAIVFIESISSSGKDLHIIGLVSDGGVHSHVEHLYALLKLIKRCNFKNNVFIHAITDGRDTSPKSALQYLAELTKQIRKIGVNARIGSLLGRYYAMDRDNRWDRTKLAYMTMTEGEGETFDSVEDGINASYSKDLSDEFVVPCLINMKEDQGSLLKKLFGSKKPACQDKATIKPGDGVIFFNTRPDRMRQITEMFLFPKNELSTKPVAEIKVLTFSTYNEYLPVPVIFPTEKIDDSLARILSDNKFSQGHFAETEKYAHVTYFFNGGSSTPNKNEFWYLVPSPKVRTYDLKPEMSAKQITDKVFSVLNEKDLDFVLINYANADMVGHTGYFDKVVRAVETVDAELKRLLKLLPETIILVTADHGNAECMIHPETGEVDKRHTVNPVPLIIVGEKYKIDPDKNVEVNPTGILADIAPAVLSLFELKKSPKMNGVNIIDNMDHKS